MGVPSFTFIHRSLLISWLAPEAARITKSGLAQAEHASTVA
jgi:hypothetical protein